MTTLADFFVQNIAVIYFLYGLVFYSMGLAVWLESGRSSELRLAYALRPLAVFGIMHGIHEWGEMIAKIVGTTVGYHLSNQELLFQHIWLACSFAALALFGTTLLVSPRWSGKGTPRSQKTVL